MSVFTRPAENQAKLYIKGLVKGDMKIVSEDKTKGIVKIKVADDGSLETANGEPVTFLRSLLVSLPASLVEYGYPHTLMMNKNQTLTVKPSIWMLIDEESKGGLIEHLQSQEHEMTIREFKVMTR